MIEVTLERNKVRAKLSVKGHAEVNDDHKEICAGASTLLYTVAQNINDMKADGYFGNKAVRIHTDNGNGSVSFPCGKKPTLKEILALRSVIVICKGFELLAHNFPEDVSYTSSVKYI